MTTETPASETRHPDSAPPAVSAAAGYFAPLAELQHRLSAEDRAAVADLVLRFEWCYDVRNYEALADMLTDDAVIDHVWGYREGKQAFLTLLRDWEYANAGLRHQGTNLVVWGEPDGTAAAMSYLFGVTMSGPLTADPDNPEDGEAPAYDRAAGHGLVTDRFRRGADGIWRMTRRTIDQMYIDPAFLADEDGRRWFALSADERRAAAEQPPGWAAPEGS